MLKTRHTTNLGFYIVCT